MGTEAITPSWVYILGRNIILVDGSNETALALVLICRYPIVCALNPFPAKGQGELLNIFRIGVILKWEFLFEAKLPGYNWGHRFSDSGMKFISRNFLLLKSNPIIPRNSI